MLLHRKDYPHYIDPTVNASQGVQQVAAAPPEHYGGGFSDSPETRATRICERLQCLGNARKTQKFNLK